MFNYFCLLLHLFPFVPRELGYLLNVVCLFLSWVNYALKRYFLKRYSQLFLLLFKTVPVTTSTSIYINIKKKYMIRFGGIFITLEYIVFKIYLFEWNECQFVWHSWCYEFMNKTVTLYWFYFIFGGFLWSSQYWKQQKQTLCQQQSILYRFFLRFIENAT